jgi:hypothetical protein
LHSVRESPTRIYAKPSSIAEEASKQGFATHAKEVTHVMPQNSEARFLQRTTATANTAMPFSAVIFQVGFQDFVLLINHFV